MNLEPSQAVKVCSELVAWWDRQAKPIPAAVLETVLSAFIDRARDAITSGCVSVGVCCLPSASPHFDCTRTY